MCVLYCRHVGYAWVFWAAGDGECSCQTLVSKTVFELLWLPLRSGDVSS
jgi:hypothetical protein